MTGQNDFDLIMNQEIQEKRLLGGAISVIHDGKRAFEEYYGSCKRDSIYKIYSMSKPLTSAAIMILMERGVINLDNPISNYLPGFNQMKIIDDNNCLHPAKNVITIQHLLNMTSGLGYPLDITTCDRQWIALEKDINERISQGEKFTNEKICNEFARAPLAFEPGTKWKYGANADVLGGIIENVTNMTFGDFMEKEIFKPLEMVDTGFYISAPKLNRLAQMYVRKQDGTLESPFLDSSCSEQMQSLTLPPVFQNNVKKPLLESGGAGIYSTMEDYIHFMQMLVNKGEYKGKRFLATETVEFMISNQLNQTMRNEIYKDTVAGFCLQGYGYSNLLRIMQEPQNASSYGCKGGAGEYGWDGLPGNYFMIDPDKKLCMLYMQQIEQGADFELRNKIRKAAYDMVK